MRFVDEFRDPEMARVLATQIACWRDADRQYKFMEVCGGHTHTIYKLYQYCWRGCDRRRHELRSHPPQV